MPTDFSSHFVCSVFDRSFDIAFVLQNQTFNLFSLPCHVLIIYSCTDYKKLTLSWIQYFLNFYSVAALWNYNKPLFPKILLIPTFYIGKYFGLRNYQHPLVDAGYGVESFSTWNDVVSKVWLLCLAKPQHNPIKLYIHSPHLPIYPRVVTPTEKKLQIWHSCYLTPAINSKV